MQKPPGLEEGSQASPCCVVGPLTQRPAGRRRTWSGRAGGPRPAPRPLLTEASTAQLAEEVEQGGGKRWKGHGSRTGGDVRASVPPHRRGGQDNSHIVLDRGR